MFFHEKFNQFFTECTYPCRTGMKVELDFYCDYHDDFKKIYTRSYFKKEEFKCTGCYENKFKDISFVGEKHSSEKHDKNILVKIDKNDWQSRNGLCL